MCGIAGIVITDDSNRNDDAVLKMLSAAAHRGKDGEGVFRWKNVALGHRRLAIIDLREEASQPMLYRDRYAIVYNGEIYNYMELRDFLIKQGYHFISRSDTEVILAAYDFWGAECVSRFNGMWALAILDKQKELLFCSRDRFGIKPFYYFFDRGVFCFASEIKQLLAVKRVTKVNPGVLFNYLFSGFEEYSTETFFSGIHSLPPAHNFIFRIVSGEIEKERYYSLNKKDIGTASDKELTDLFRETLTDSVRLRLRSDVRVGTCLSGGLDSSSIASIAAGLHAASSAKEPFTAIHGKSIEKSTDESGYARKVADYCRLHLVISENSAGEFRDILPKVIETQEEPFGSPSVVMQYFVMEKARQEGVVVMLDGQGGDELLLGYERYYVSWLLSQKGLSKIGGFFKASENSKLSPFTLLQYYFYFSCPQIRLARIKKRFRFIRPEFLRSFDTSLLLKNARDFRDMESLQRNELLSYQLPHLLKYEDRNSMAHSIEARLPFLDFRLVELSLALPIDLKIRAGFTKFILRQSMAGKLPDEILWRRNKFGFNAPVQSWLSDRENIFGVIRDSVILAGLCRRKVPEDVDLTVLWRLYNIALWERRFGMEW